MAVAAVVEVAVAVVVVVAPAAAASAAVDVDVAVAVGGDVARARQLPGALPTNLPTWRWLSGAAPPFVGCC